MSDAKCSLSEIPKLWEKVQGAEAEVQRALRMGENPLTS